MVFVSYSNAVVSVDRLWLIVACMCFFLMDVQAHWRGYTCVLAWQRGILSCPKWHFIIAEWHFIIVKRHFLLCKDALHKSWSSSKTQRTMSCVFLCIPRLCRRQALHCANGTKKTADSESAVNLSFSLFEQMITVRLWCQQMLCQQLCLQPQLCRPAQLQEPQPCYHKMRKR